MKLREKIFKIKRVLQEIMLLRKNYYNWDGILKRAIGGKTTTVLNHRTGINFYDADNNTMSIIREIFINKVYTKNNVKIESGDVVFDVGANVGVFSLYASLIKGTKVFSFEPHPENFKKLSNNVKTNKINNINCLNFALGIDNEDRYMIEGNIPGGHKVSNKKTPKTLDLGGVKVESITLESIMNKLNVEKIDFLKLDCEGAEGEVITSLGVDGLKKINKIAVEFHDNHSILNHSEIDEYLKMSGFKTILSWDGKSYFGYIYGNR
jgi:FkbM family methyltransferase